MLEFAELEHEGGEACVGIGDGVVGIDVLELLGVDKFQLQIGETGGEGIAGRRHAITIDLAEHDGVAFGNAGVQIWQLADEMTHGGLPGLAFIKIQRQRSLV